MVLVEHCTETLVVHRPPLDHPPCLPAQVAVDDVRPQLRGHLAGQAGEFGEDSVRRRPAEREARDALHQLRNAGLDRSPRREQRALGVLLLQAVAEHETRQVAVDAGDLDRIDAVDIDEAAERSGVVIHRAARLVEFEHLGLVRDPGDLGGVAGGRIAREREQRLCPADAHRRRARHAGIHGDRAREDEVAAAVELDAAPFQHVDAGGQVVAMVAVCERFGRDELVRLGQIGHVNDERAVVARPRLDDEVEVDGHRDDAEAEEVLVLAVQADSAGHGNANEFVLAVHHVVHQVPQKHSCLAVVRFLLSGAAR